MSGLISEIFASFTTVIQGIAEGLKTAFSNLLYVDPAVDNPAFSPLVLFLFTILGLGLATGIIYKVFGLIKRRG